MLLYLNNGQDFCSNRLAILIYVTVKIICIQLVYNVDKHFFK